jgi:mannose-6-phosphate isomerase-like protein (cupin superfamily)
MTNKVSKENADHYKWGEDCDGWRLKKENNFTVTVESMPAGTAEIKHLHQRSEQFFFCLEGTLAIELDGETQELSAQEGMTIPTGTPHKVRNASNRKASFLLVSCPDTHEDRISLE